MNTVSPQTNRFVDFVSRTAVRLMNLPVPSTTPRLDDEKRAEMDQILQPGDFVLQTDNNFPGWQISQRLLFGAEYSHVAMYVGDGKIIDADTGSGVSEQTSTASAAITLPCCGRATGT